MLSYETYCKIRDHLGRQSLTQAQTAQALGLDVRIVAKWADTAHPGSTAIRPKPPQLPMKSTI